jgi:hypothetical protein
VFISGQASGGYHTPHIYFIFSHEVIYIGETQVIPVRRWSSHLDSGGSFTKKLKKYLDGKSTQKYMDSLNFISFSCLDMLKDIQKSYCGYRIPTQALEHKLHEIAIAESIFGSEKIVLSETNKTVPRTFYHWSDIDDLARAVTTKLTDCC